MMSQPQAWAMISAVRRVRPKSLLMICVMPSSFGTGCHLHRLLLTFGGQRAVRLALNTSLGVPLRFTVAD